MAHEHIAVSSKALEAYLSRLWTHRENVQVTNLVNINAGWESDVYAYTLAYGENSATAQEGQILRLYPGTNAERVCVREFTGMGLLKEAGYPVPHVLAMELDATIFGRPFLVMEKIDGKMLWHLMDNALPEQMDEYLKLFARLFVGLHQLDWQPWREEWFATRAFGYERMQTTADAIDFQLDRMRSMHRLAPDPGFLPLLDWLDEHRKTVPSVALTPIHWDFHPGNIMICEDGEAFVIDWTQVQLSDPRFDLAWTRLLVGAHADWNLSDRIVRDYYRIAGSEFEAFEYFEVFSCVKRLGAILLSLTQGADTVGMRPGAEQMMREAAGPLGEVYAFLRRLTDIRVEAVEQTLDSLHVEHE